MNQSALVIVYQGVTPSMLDDRKESIIAIHEYGPGGHEIVHEQRHWSGDKHLLANQLHARVLAWIGRNEV